MSQAAGTRMLEPSVVSRLGSIDFIARALVEGFLVGLHRSPYHGFSVEFAEYRQYRRIRRWEKSLSRRFSAIITNSAIDNDFLKTLDPAGNMVAIGNGVDSEFFTPAGAAVEATWLVFTGVVDYPPNEDAVLYFCDAILPLIRARCPNVQFWVVGKYPTESVKAREQRPGVVVTGGVPDVRPYIDAAAVFVCPLRYGTGVKNKILAALSMQKAVVATRISLEGLDLQEDEHILAADEPEAFADQVIRLIEDRELAARLGRTGRDRVSSSYSLESSAATLESLLGKAVEEYQQVA